MSGGANAQLRGCGDVILMQIAWLGGVWDGRIDLSTPRPSPLRIKVHRGRTSKERVVCAGRRRIQATQPHTIRTDKVQHAKLGEMVVRTRTVTVLPRMHMARKVMLGSLDADVDATTRDGSPRPRPRPCLPLFILKLFGSTTMLLWCYRLVCTCTERRRPLGYRQ